MQNHGILDQVLQKNIFLPNVWDDLTLLLHTVCTDCKIEVCIMSDPRPPPSIIINAWPSAQQWRDMDKKNDYENDPTIMSQKFCHFWKDYSKNSTDCKQCQR